jgi:hypothetical protein
VTGNPEVKDSSAGLVPKKALIATNPRIVGDVVIIPVAVEKLAFLEKSQNWGDRWKNHSQSFLT